MHTKKMLAMAGAAAGVATVLGPSGAYAQPAEAQSNDVALSSMRQNIVNWAVNEAHDPAHNREYGGYNCNYYSTVFRSGQTGVCSNGWRSEKWCAEFAKFVWKNGQADIAGLDGRTESFEEYGKRHGTWHPGNLDGVQPGDAVLYKDSQGGNWSSHVGVVVTVNGWQVDVVSGNIGRNGVDGVYKHGVNDPVAEVKGYVRPVA